MNGIKASIVLSMYTPKNAGHAANTVTVNGKTKYLDLLLGYDQDSVPKNFVVDFNSSEN